MMDLRSIQDGTVLRGDANAAETAANPNNLGLT